MLPGLARLSLEQDEGATYNLRIVKSKDAAPVRVVRPGDDGVEDAVSILKVSELENWCFYFTDIASKAGVTRYEAEALIYVLGLKDDEQSYRVFAMGKQMHGRYSGRALRLIREAKTAGRIEEAKAALREHRRVQRDAKKAKKATGAGARAVVGRSPGLSPLSAIAYAEATARRGGLRAPCSRHRPTS